MDYYLGKLLAFNFLYGPRGACRFLGSLGFEKNAFQNVFTRKPIGSQFKKIKASPQASQSKANHNSLPSQPPIKNFCHFPNLATIPAAQRVWLLLEEFQTGSGSRTELLGIFRILWQARVPSLATTLPQRVRLLLEELQAGPGNRTDLLGCSGKLTWFLWLLHGWLPLPSPPLSSPLLPSPLLSSPLLSSPRPWRQSRAAGNLSDLEPSSLYKSCYKPCRRESGCCFLKSSRQARAAEQSCWQSFGSSGKLTFQVLLQPCHRELGCFLKSSRQVLAAEQSCLENFYMRGQAHFTNLATNPATESLAASWRVLGRQSFGSSGKLTFQVLLQPCHRELGCFLKSSRQASAWKTFTCGAKLTLQILLQTLPHRVWLLLEEFQTCSGSRTELLGIFRILWQRIPSLATTLPQRVWLLLEEFQAGPGNRTDLLGCSGKPPFQILLQPASKSCCYFLLLSTASSLCPRSTELSGLWSHCSLAIIVSGCSLVPLATSWLAALCPLLAQSSPLPKASCQKLLAATVSGRKRAQEESILCMFLGPGLRSKGCDANRCATDPCSLVASGSIWHPPNQLERPWAGRCPFPFLSSPLLSSPLLSSPPLPSPLLSSPLLSSPILTQALAAEQSCWEPFRSGAKLTLQILLQTLPQRVWLLLLEEF